MGCGEDPLTPDVLKYDVLFGKDAQNPDLEQYSMDFVFSSHCLEHLPEPHLAIRRWWDLVKLGGHMVVSVPDWTLYEQKQWPSKYNWDHKWTFSITRPPTLPHSKHIVVPDLLVGLPLCQVLSIKLCDTNYNYEPKHYDRTWHDKAEAEIEIVCRKVNSLFWTW